jgi:D-lactate dehydrogenase
MGRVEHGFELLLDSLRDAVGARHLIVEREAIRPFVTGYRFGGGSALAVVRPGSLVEMWRVLKCCTEHRVSMIFQAANTGLTGGSTPMEGGYDRPIIVVNTLRIGTVHPIADGRQVICLPGATLDALERLLLPYDREPHSVIGSSCIGASVIGGVCNNSGGALVRRGPAYTELALFARIDKSGKLSLINNLGIAIDGKPEEVLARVERGDFSESEIKWPEDRAASDMEYASHVRDIAADTPARFNADPRRHFEAAGSSGKIAIFAVRLDTFPRDPSSRVFYIGTNVAEQLETIRREMLAGLSQLPVAAEYIHRDAFDIARLYGKDTFLAIRWLGTHRLPSLFALKRRIDGIVRRAKLGSHGFSDRLMQRISTFIPDHLPARLCEYRDRFEHHLMLRVTDETVVEVAGILDRILQGTSGAYFACTEHEGQAAFLHRFAAAGAAVRYRTMHPAEVEDIVALDFALPRNAQDWCIDVVEDDRRHVIHDLRYGHFFCHVIHEDLIVARGADTMAIKERAVERLERLSCECPAEHNVGQLYRAKPNHAAFFRELDPTNSFNPGVGRMPRGSCYHE